MGMKAVTIIPREPINIRANNIKIFINLPAGTHSVYNISSFCWILFSLIIRCIF